MDWQSPFFIDVSSVKKVFAACLSTMLVLGLVESRKKSSSVGMQSEDWVFERCLWKCPSIAPFLTTWPQPCPFPTASWVSKSQWRIRFADMLSHFRIMLLKHSEFSSVKIYLDFYATVFWGRYNLCFTWCHPSGELSEVRHWTVNATLYVQFACPPWLVTFHNF